MTRCPIADRIILGAQHFSELWDGGLSELADHFSGPQLDGLIRDRQVLGPFREGSPSDLVGLGKGRKHKSRRDANDDEMPTESLFGVHVKAIPERPLSEKDRFVEVRMDS